jgi:hypothetical protein
VRGMVDAGIIRLPMAVDARPREDFTLFVMTPTTGLADRC